MLGKSSIKNPCLIPICGGRRKVVGSMLLVTVIVRELVLTVCSGSISLVQNVERGK